MPPVYVVPTLMITTKQKRRCNQTFLLSVYPAESDQSDSHSPRSPNLCYGCKKPLDDSYRLRVSPDMEWHPSCLVCTECKVNLDEYCTCFMRDGRPYCRNDFMRSAPRASGYFKLCLYQYNYIFLWFSIDQCACTRLKNSKCLGGVDFTQGF